MIKPLRFFAAGLSLALLGAIAPSANAAAPGIAPIVIIGVASAAGPVLALGEEVLDSFGLASSEARGKAEEAMKSADWTKAKRVSVKLEDDLINPAWLRLKAGKPYILEISNTDGDSGTLRAPGFFAGAATDENGPTMGWTSVGADEKREFRLIAVEKGVYDMDMGLFARPWGYIGKIEVY